MKNLITYLKTLWGAWGNLQSSDVSLDRRLTVGSPSGFNSKLMLKLVFVLVLILTIGSGNVWGAKDDVVYKINTASTKIATSTTYANYGPSTCASAQAGSTVSSASWCVTCGSAQTEGLWLGANNNQKAKMTLGNGSFTEASGIASAIGVTTSATYYAAMICRTNLSKVYKVTLTYATPGGTAPSEAWILYSTDNGSTWSVGKKVTSLSTSGTDFVFDATITSAARYAFVIHSTGYCQFKKPVLTFYEGTTGGTTYTVTYNLNGGTGTTPTESAKSSGATFSLHNGTTGITPPSGKVFSQWKDQDNNYYNGGATYTMPAKNVTLTAQWVNTYTVTYNLNGGTGTTPTEGAHPSGATFTLHDGTTGITAPTKKEFSKWRDQDGTDYNGGVTYTMPAKAVTLTAQWVAAGGDYVLVEDAEDIGPGKYLIVYNNAKALNTHYGNVNANTYATYTDISSYYSNKKIAANATTNALAYTVAETANGYSISHIESGTTYYLGNSSNSTGAYLRWDNPFTASTDEWTLGVNSIVSARNSNYAIRWNNNSGSYRFAIYNPTGQQAVQLFKQEEAFDGPTITVSKTAIEFGDKKVGGTYTETFTVSGENLTGAINLAVSGAQAGKYSVSTTTLSPTAGTVAETTITVTFAPTASSDHAAQVDITSDGATAKTVSLHAISKWEVTWKNDGAVYVTTLVQGGHKPTFPATPTSCDTEESNVFYGWTDAEWPGKIDNVSAKTIHKSNATMPNASNNTTIYYAVFVKRTGSANDYTDQLTRATTTVPDQTGTTVTYTDWSEISASNSGHSDAVYAGNSAGDKNSIQLRASTNSGIITTTSGGKAKKVTVDWNSNSASGRTIDVYGKNSAYTATSELYGEGKGTKIGSIVYGTSTELTIDDDYEYIGIRSNSNALYLDEISIDWQVGEYTYSKYMTNCCDYHITVATPTKTGTGTGTVAFASGGSAVAAGSDVATCAGTTTITATVTPNPGHQCDALSFTGGSVSVSPAIPDPFVPFDNAGATTYTLTFAQNTNATLATAVTFTQLHDYYIDYMHDNAKVTKSGNYGTAPSLSSTTPGDGCAGSHYKFIGWVPESDMNMETGVPNTTTHMVTGGQTGMYATGTNYYAIWAEEVTP